MRRVYDDTMLQALANKMITKLAECTESKALCEYSYGTDRASTWKIRDLMLSAVDNVIIGNDQNHTNIGNNWCRELVYTGDEKEQQIFGLLHITDDMYGGCYVWVSDIDGNRVTNTYIVRYRGIEISRILD